MTVVKINAITVAAGSGDELARGSEHDAGIEGYVDGIETVADACRAQFLGQPASTFAP